MFWADDAFVEDQHPRADAWYRCFETARYGPLTLDRYKDESWVRANLASPELDACRREMMLWVELREFGLNPAESLADRCRALRKLVTDHPNLTRIVDQAEQPTPESAEMKRLREQGEAHRQEADQKDAEARRHWEAFWQELATRPDLAFGPTRAESTAWKLWHAMAATGPDSREEGWNRPFIEHQFGRDISDRLRRELMRLWRNDTPTLRSEREPDKRGTYLVRWQLGLAGITAETEDPTWARKLSDAEARRACRYIALVGNGFPVWTEALIEAHPVAVDEVFGREVTLQLGEVPRPGDFPMVLQNLVHAAEPTARLFLPRLMAWIRVNVHGGNTRQDAAGQTLSLAVEAVAKHGDAAAQAFLVECATTALARSPALQELALWLQLLLRFAPGTGVDSLAAALAGMPEEPDCEAVQLIALLFGDHRRRIELGVLGSDFPPGLLLTLIRLGYRHIRRDDDTDHGVPPHIEARDDAERGRGLLLNALFAQSGEEAWQAKLELAADPSFAFFRDRALVLAREKLAEDADRVPITIDAIQSLERVGEAPPATRDAMFALMRDRLDDIDELLLTDNSPRETWAGLRKEHLLRRELARALETASRGLYRVDQEAVTADEKETDLRLRSILPPAQAVIEVKIGENGWSGAALRDTLADQVVKRYMAAADCRAGCLLISVATERHWQHPDTEARLDLAALGAMLEFEADRLVKASGNTIRLMVKVLDLRPRLAANR